MSTKLVVGLFAVVVAFQVPVAAHHAFSAEFDADMPINFKGTVSKVEWINPHSWIHVDVKEKDGKTVTWMIEAGTPNTLLRRGVSRVSLPVGTEIVVNGYRAKDGSHRANGRDLTLPDGRALFIGAEGTGAPSDGKDPAAKK